MIRKIHLGIAIALATSVFFFSGCRPLGNEFISDFDLVFTSYDVNFSFESRQTYSLPDTVLLLGSDPENPEVSPFNARIVSALDRAMRSAGWERVEAGEGDAADLVMLPMVSATNFQSCTMPCWECGWGGWGGWGDYPYYGNSGWGWGYPPVMACNEFNTASLYVVLSDPNNPDTLLQEIPVVWKGVANGLLEGSDASIASRIDLAISQMFTQSPYLKLNNQ